PPIAGRIKRWLRPSRRWRRLGFACEILNDSDKLSSELRQLAVSDAFDCAKLIGRLRPSPGDLFERAVVQNHVGRDAERRSLLAPPLLQRLYQLRADGAVRLLDGCFISRRPRARLSES